MCVIEPNEIEQIYQVLKQTGAIPTHKLNDKQPQHTSLSATVAAAAAAAAAANNSSTNNGQAMQQEIPTLNVPECPERIQRRGQVKLHTQNTTQAKHNLAAPKATNDVSSSGLTLIFYL